MPWSNERENRVSSKFLDFPIRFRTNTMMLGTMPNNPDIYREYVASKAPDAKTMEDEIAQSSVEDVVSKGTTVFPKGKFLKTADNVFYDPNYDIIPEGLDLEEVIVPFMWAYQWRGSFKESIAMLQRASGKKSKAAKAAEAKAAAEEIKASNEDAQTTIEMAEEQPKKRGRRKKADAETTAGAAKEDAAKKFAASSITAYKKTVDGNWFVKQTRIPLLVPETYVDDYGIVHKTYDENGNLPTFTRPVRADTMQGPRVTLVCSEFVPAGTEGYMTIRLLNPADFDALLETLDYKAFVGMLQWRGGGKGTLDWTQATPDGKPI